LFAVACLLTKGRPRRAAPTCPSQFEPDTDRSPCLRQKFLIWSAHPMFPIVRRACRRLRTLLSVLMLAVCCAWAPLTIAAADSDTCAMDCCVQAGHCCCIPAHARVEGQVPDSGDRFETAQISSKCPAGCATQSSSQLSFRDGRSSAGRQTLSGEPADRGPTEPLSSLDLLLQSSSSPRAPPSI
jgi:hypothetical protein